MADNYCKCCGDGTPEYIIELNQQGAPGKRGEKGDEGYSPIVDFIVDDNEIKFTSTNENNITSTPNLYDFVLKKDGSNAPNPIKLNQIYIKNNSIYTQSSSIDFGDSSSNNQHIANIYYKNIVLKGNSPLLRNDHGDLRIVGQDSLYIEAVSGNISLANTIHITDNIPYIGTPEVDNKIATIGDMPKVSDSKITISQGNVVKGSFTLNQSGDTTIELDSGGEITNPLKITKDNKTLEIGYDENDRVYISNTTIGAGGGTSTNIALITPNVYHDPIRLQQITNIPDLAGQYYVKLNYDNNTLKLNDNKQLYADFTEINNSISELTTLANNTEASLNVLKTDYETNKTDVAEELTTLGNQLNTKVSKAELDELADTKNDNIFDIGKFTVIGNPTITDDGVASGFSSSNNIRIPFPSSVTNFTAELNFKFNDTSIASYSGYCIHAGSSPFMIYINASNGKYGNINTVFTNSDISTQYNFGNISGSSHFLTERVYFEYILLNNILSCRVRFGETGDWINFPTTYTITDVILTKAYSLLASYSSAFNCDLKHFSITVDGEKIFNGLMSSTVPIYDKIATTNTTLSTFKTDATNNFSAVNSALNEKANISDLANYVPLATYNSLLARVEALEAEINGGNA